MIAMMVDTLVEFFMCSLIKIKQKCNFYISLILVNSFFQAAFLTVERMESPIESAEDLAKWG